MEYSTAWRCSIASTDPTLGGSTLKHEGRRQTGRRSAYAGSRLKLIDASGRSRLTSQPFSRNEENSPCGMIGGIVETSASFEARSAPRSYPTNWYWLVDGLQDAGITVTPISRPLVKGRKYFFGGANRQCFVPCLAATVFEPRPFLRFMAAYQ